MMIKYMLVIGMVMAKIPWPCVAVTLSMWKNTIASGVADEAFSYGKTSDTVLVGDWDGDGKDTFMVRR